MSRNMLYRREKGKVIHEYGRSRKFPDYLLDINVY